MRSHYTTHPKSKATRIRVMGRTVGEVRPDGVFQKRVCGSRHFLRTPPAIALDVDSLHQAEAAGARSVEIFDEETGLTYRAALSTFREHGFRVSRGFGEQLALKFARWNTGPGREEAEQLPLFGIAEGVRP